MFTTLGLPPLSWAMTQLSPWTMPLVEPEPEPESTFTAQSSAWGATPKTPRPLADVDPLD